MSPLLSSRTVSHSEPSGAPSRPIRIAVAGSIALLLNTSYLVAWPSASLWYFVNVTLHPLLGVAVAVSLAVAVRRRGSPPESWLGAGLACVAIGLATGVVPWCTTPLRAESLP